MSVCKAKPICKLPHFLNTSTNHLPNNLFCTISLPHKTQGCFVLRSVKSDDTSSGTNKFPNAKVDSVENVEDKKSYDIHGFGRNAQNQNPIEEPGIVVHDEYRPDVAYEEGSLLDVKNKVAEFADKLNLKFDPEDSYSIALYGSSAAAALYLATAVIGALDSIPLFPKLLEVVGLGYSVWFANRYLLFKKNRDELVAKIEELKQQVLGTEDE